jgi:O-antigen ligase
MNLITSTVPSIIAYYYLFITHSEKRYKIFINLLVIITIVTVAYVIIDYPFEQGTIYEFKPGKWSHVIYGRIIGCTAVILLLFTLSRSSRKEVLFYSLVTSLAVYGLYLSALRSAFLGILFVGVVMLLFIILKPLIVSRKQNSTLSLPKRNEGMIHQLTGILSIGAITILLILIIPKPAIIETRFDNLLQAGNLEFGGDPPILSRIEAFELSKEIFFQYPLFGVGLGGFRNYNDNNFSEVVKYPHNIFLEFTIEGGVIGLIILCILLFFIFKSVSRISVYLLIFVFYSLWLAVFSKDIPSQIPLWIFIAMINVKSSKADVQSPKLGG